MTFNLLSALLAILFTYGGTIVAKYILFLFARFDFIKLWGEQNYKKMVGLYLATPLFAARFLGKDLRLESIKYKQLSSLTVIFEILGAVTFLFFMFFLSRVSASNHATYELVVVFCFQAFFIASLLYLAIFDTLHLAIPLRFTKFTMFVVVGANLLVGGIRFLFSLTGEQVLQHVALGRVDNLLAGTLLGLLMWLIVKTTREKGLGEGDIDIMMIVGLASGWPGVLIAFISTLVLGSLVSLLYAFYIRKYKGVLVPFVPLILLGYLVALAFGREIFALIVGV